MRRRHALLVAAVLGATVFYAGRPADTPVSRAAGSSEAVTESVPDKLDSREFNASLLPPIDPATARRNELRPRLVRSSLRGTTPDGDVQLDAAGGVAPHPGLVRLFDYWLTLTGEFSDEEVRVLLHGDASDRYGDAVASEVLALFDRYLGLRAQLASTPPATDLETRLRNLSSARQAWFDTDAEAMFGAEEAETAYTLERQRLLDADLDSTERETQLAELEARRPTVARASERETTAAVLATEQTRQLDVLGADERTRHAERSELWGRDAADRLAALDAERERWNARVAAFARERERVIADSRLDAAARQLTLDALLRRDFSEPERARVEALARTGGLPPGG